MSSKAVTAYLVEMLARAGEGVDFSRRRGALCPACGKPAKIVRTFPWDGDVRVRYHRCQTAGCVLPTTGATIKSVEVDG